MLLASSLAFFLVVFLIGSIVTAVAWMAFLKMRAEQSEAAHLESEKAGPGASAEGEAHAEPKIPALDSTLFRDERFSTITFWDSLLARFDFVEILKTHCEQAQLDWSVGRITSMMLLLGAVAFAVLMRFIPVWSATLAACGVAITPYFYISSRRRKRFHKFRENFPDVLDSLARALRAGYPLSAAMEMIAAETSPPVSEEMRRTSAEANLGRGWPHALENLGRRIPLLEVNMFTSAVQLHARTGGKLSEVMAGMAENMREALALQGEVRSLAAHGRLTGMVLTILPIGIAVMMMFVSPTYMQILFQHPWGKNLIAAAIACLVIAHFVIRKIVDIEV
ncbi:MAG TPA: type II secretion system F family protein [Bryobacteraceae bacterium]|nr:type II secretion system F family protein [Bryobacteraceae bacterium]